MTIVLGSIEEVKKVHFLVYLGPNSRRGILFSVPQFSELNNNDDIIV